jgi:hypothetical protein
MTEHDGAPPHRGVDVWIADAAAAADLVDPYGAAFKAIRSRGA